MKKSFLILVVLTCLSFLIYARTLNYPLVFDDHHVITYDPSIRNLADVPRLFVSAHMEQAEKSSTSYRPFLYATYALNYAISGTVPWSYRLFDILSHALCSFMVYLISLIIIKERGDKNTWPAAAMAVMFCVHPAQTESVIYVSARSAELVCTLFLASVYFYLKARTRPDDGRHGSGLFVISLIALALALLTKETAAALLPFFFVLEYYFRKKKGAGISWPFLASATAMTVAFAAYRLSLVFGGGNGAKPDYIGHWAGWISRFPSYVALLAVPFSQSIEHPEAGKLININLFIGIAVIAVSLFLIFRQFRRGNYLVAGLLLLAALSFLPEFLFPIWDLVVDYRLYLPLAAFCIAGAAALARLSGPRAVMAAKYAAAAASLIFLFLSFSRAGAWASEKSLWGDAAAKYPTLVRPHNELGIYYLKHGQFGKARMEFETVLSLDPSFVKAYDNLGADYIRMGEFSRAQDVLLKGLSISNLYSMRFNLETAYIKEKNDSAAMLNFEATLGGFPNHNVLRDFTNTALILGRPDLAQAFAEYASGQRNP